MPTTRRPSAPSTATRRRILQAARDHLFAHDYSSLTMDGLADGLGMSKKTLYVHFPSKEAIVRQVILDFGREVRTSAEAVLRDPRLSFAEKLQRFVEGMLQRTSRLCPHLLSDVQRCAPEIHQLLAEIRGKNIPYIFGRLIAEGQAAGMIRTDIDPVFTTEFLLHAMQGLLQPATLERLQLAPRDIFRNTINLYFGGLLTPAGRTDYEKHFAS